MSSAAMSAPSRAISTACARPYGVRPTLTASRPGNQRDLTFQFTHRTVFSTLGSAARRGQCPTGQRNRPAPHEPDGIGFRFRPQSHHRRFSPVGEVCLCRVSRRRTSHRC